MKEKLRVWWIPQVGLSDAFYIPVKSVEEGKKVMDILAAYDAFQLQNNIILVVCKFTIQRLQTMKIGIWKQKIIILIILMITVSNAKEQKN